MKPLDNNNAVPLYEQMITLLRDHLDNHVIAAGERLPSEAELCKKYGVSRITVRRAIDELVEEGYLERKQGKGTFVTQKRAAVSVMSLEDHATEGFSSRYGKETNRLHSIVVSKKEYKANKNERALLGLDEDDHVLILTRLMVVDEKPWMIDRATYSAKRYPGFFEQIEDGVSTYKLMREKYDVHMSRARREITLAYATNEQAKLLECAPSAPLFKTFKVVYDEQDQPVHLSSTYSQAENVVLTIENGHYQSELIEK